MADKKKTPENESSVHDEMEELARIFREELGKAREEAEKEENEADADTETGTDIDALKSDYEVEGYAVTTGKKVENKPEEMCECCGERPRGTERDPNSPFCEECAAIMEKYPYDWKGILMLIAVIGAMLVSVVTFIQITPIFASVHEGNAAYNDNRLFSALMRYSDAESYIVENEISLEFNTLRKNEIKLFYEFGSDEFIEKNFGNPPILCALTLIENTYDLKDISNKKIAEVFDVIVSTRANVLMLSTYEPEETADGKTVTLTDSEYKALIDKYESLIGKNIYVADITNMDSTNVFDDITEGKKPSGSETAIPYDEGWIRFYQYALAESQNKTDDMTFYLDKAAIASTKYENYSDMFFSQFCFKNKNYAQAEAAIKRIGERNKESVFYYAMLSKLYRQRDKNYSAAKEVCFTGLETAAASYKNYDLIAYAGSYLSVEKTLNFIMLEDYENAYASVKEAVSYQNDFYGETVPQTRDLLAILALKTNDTEKYDEIVETVTAEVEAYGENYAMSSYVEDYKNNKITLEDVVNSGYFDRV